MIDILCTHLNTPSDSLNRNKILSKMCICLGDWSQYLSSSMNILFQKQTSTPHNFLQQVLFFNFNN